MAIRSESNLVMMMMTKAGKLCHESHILKSKSYMLKNIMLEVLVCIKLKSLIFTTLSFSIVVVLALSSSFFVLTSINFVGAESQD